VVGLESYVGYESSLALTEVVSCDLNGDGVLDLIALRSGEKPPGFGFEVFFGQPDGGLSEPTSYGGSEYALAVGDVNGDGAPDVVVAYGPDVLVFANDGAGNLAIQTTITTSASWIADIGIGDVNGDGYADLVLTENGDGPPPFVELFLGGDAGAFAAPVLVPGIGGTPWEGLLVADVNQDGLADIVANISDGGQLAVLLSNGDGGFSTNLYPTPSWGGVTLVSQGTGAPDLVLGTTMGTTQILKNLGDGTFSTGPSYEVPGTLYVAGDFNGDCITDIAISLEADCDIGTGQLVILYGDGDGGYDLPASLECPGSAPAGVAVMGVVGVGPKALAVGESCGGGVTVYGDASRR
jgi:hypothetical protein